MHVFLLLLIAPLGEQSPQLDPAKVEFFREQDQAGSDCQVLFLPQCEFQIA